MFKENIGIIEVMPENGSEKAIKEALQKKELLDAITSQDYSSKTCQDIIQEAINEVLGL